MYEELEELKPNTFTQAADIIVSDGWTRRNYRDARGFCALGALSYVLTDGDDVAYVSGFRGSQAALLLGVKNVTAWNDDPKTTKTEVVTRLRAASHILAHDFDVAASRRAAAEEAGEAA